MNKESDESMGALFEEAALILSDKEESTPPMAGKTPTTHNYGAALATAVDGGRGDLYGSRERHFAFAFTFTFTFTRGGRGFHGEEVSRCGGVSRCTDV